MRILMITPYPPYRDGIGAYAAQHVRQLLREGHDVEVLSPTPSAAHHHLAFTGWRGPLALAKRTPGYDRVIVQYHPDVFYPNPVSRRTRLLITLGLAAAWRRARDVEVRVHEADYGGGSSRRGVQRWASRLAWRQVDDVVLHSERERADFARCYGVPGERLGVSDHGAHFVARTTVDRSQARRRLGLPDDGHVFVAIGFVQPHKGFDRAVRAFAGLDRFGARLEVVGSVRVEDPAFVAYADDLADLAECTPGVTFHQRFVSDEEFDAWIVAADTVVLPYRHIWSSSVLERCELYGRHAIATRVGGLADQGVADAEWVDDDDELRDAMRRRVTGAASASVAAASPWTIVAGADGAPERERLQAEIRRRAGTTSGGRSSGAAASAPSDAGRRPGPVIPGTTPGDGWAAQLTRPLRRVPPLATPVAASRRSMATTVKRVVRRLTSWEVDPVVHQLNMLREATIQSLDALAEAAAPGTARDHATAERTNGGPETGSGR